MVNVKEFRDAIAQLSATSLLVRIDRGEAERVLKRPLVPLSYPKGQFTYRHGLVGWYTAVVSLEWAHLGQRDTQFWALSLVSPSKVRSAGAERNSSAREPK